MVNIRIAYCLTVHTRPEQTGRLLDRIGDAGDHYYVDVFNKGLEEKWRQALDRPSLDIETVFKYANGWGSFKLVQATLDAMEHFREMPYDYFINLSGQCYPLRTVEHIKQRLGIRAVPPAALVGREWRIPARREDILPAVQARQHLVRSPAEEDTVRDETVRRFPVVLLA